MKRFILVLVLSCSLLLLFTNVSFATLYMQNFSEINYNGTIVDFFDSLLMRAYQVDNLDNLSPNGSTNATNLATLYSYLDGTTYNYFYFRLTKNVGYYGDSNNKVNYMTVKISPNQFNSGIRNLNLSRQKSDGSYNCSNSSSSGYDTIRGDYDYPSTWDKYLVIKSGNNWTFYQGQNNQNTPPTMSLKYFSNKNTLMTINVNGSNQSFIKANYNLNGWINIGYLQNYESYNELQGYFGVYSGQSNIDNANYYDTIANFQYNKSINNQYKNNLRLDYDTGYIYLNSQVCSYDHGYSLYFTGDGSDTTEVKYYYFVPNDSNLVSGDINSDNPTGLDFDFINSIEYISQYESGNNQLIIDQVFKSGDNIFGLTYDDDNFDNWGFGDFVKTITNNFFNTVSNYNNVSLNFGYLGTISSSDFMRPQNNALFDIVSLFANSFLLLGCIGFFYRTILSIATIDIDKLVKDDEDLIIL